MRKRGGWSKKERWMDDTISTIVCFFEFEFDGVRVRVEGGEGGEGEIRMEKKSFVDRFGFVVVVGSVFVGWMLDR